MKIIANGISLNYELAGGGQCLTLIHGAGENLNVWYNQAPFFSQSYKVLTYDVRGHGQTDQPKGEFPIEMCVEDLYELLNALGINETFLLGHSMGGRIALQFALKNPETVKALILSNCVGPGPKREEILQALEIFKSKGLEVSLNDRISRIFSPGFTERNPQAVEKYKSILLNNPDAFFYTIRSVKPPTAPPDLNKISCPTLIIVGEYDHVTGPLAGKIAQETIRGSRLKIFSSGHAPFLEQPEEYNKTVIEFLGTVIKKD
jgi:3-oxoadipate enol-lactonase